MTDQRSEVQTDEPVAWVVFADNGNVRLWGKDRAAPQAFADKNGLVCEPVFRRALTSRGKADGGSGALNQKTRCEDCNLLARCDDPGCPNGAAQAAGQWQLIDTFPRDGEAYLATCNRVEGGFPQVVYWDVIGRLMVPDASISYAPHFFTHWMPVPEGPVVPSAERHSCHDHPARRCTPGDCCQSAPATDREASDAAMLGMSVEEWRRERSIAEQLNEDRGSRLTFCETCDGNTMHRRASIVNGVQTFECQRCALSSTVRKCPECHGAPEPENADWEHQCSTCDGTGLSPADRGDS